MLSLLLTTLATLPASASDWTALLSEDGWVENATPSTDETGPIDLRTKIIEGNTCVRGVATVQADPDVLLAVVADIPSVLAWSSEKMIASRVLGASGDSMDYYQHLDVPDWTMAYDRFWVLRGKAATEGTKRWFRWDRFDWRAAYPELATEIDTKYAGHIEPNPNYGFWAFTPVTSGTEVRYALCSDTGGSLPGWLQKAAATKTLPGTMADAVREAKKRKK